MFHEGGAKVGFHASPRPPRHEAHPRNGSPTGPPNNLGFDGSATDWSDNEDGDGRAYAFNSVKMVYIEQLELCPVKVRRERRGEIWGAGVKGHDACLL